MANFENIIPWLLYIEDDKKTPGKIVNLGDGAGLTRLGLTSNNFGTMLPASFWTYQMSFPEAVKYAKHTYELYHWFRIQGQDIADDEVAAVMLSWGVNQIPSTAIRAAQHVLSIDEDGVMGKQTKATLNSKDPRVFVKLYRAEWEGRYRRLVDANPDKQRFMQGWLDRIYKPYPMSIPPIYA
jgi:lysozyme family protein